MSWDLNKFSIPFVIIIIKKTFLCSHVLIEK